MVLFLVFFHEKRDINFRTAVPTVPKIASAIFTPRYVLRYIYESSIPRFMTKEMNKSKF